MDRFRCYGKMDKRGRWLSWVFAPDTPGEHARLVAEAAAGGQVLFASVQTFAPPNGMVGMTPAGAQVGTAVAGAQTGRTRWKVVKEQYVGQDALPHIAPLYFDIDADGQLDKALLWARTLVEFFVAELELPKPAVRVWFSGSKGVHITVDAAALGIQPNPTLTVDMKIVAAELVRYLATTGVPDLTVDAAVYSLPRLLRLPDQINPKSGLHKVELYHSELFQLSAEQIMELARLPRGSLWPSSSLCLGEKLSDELAPNTRLIPTAARWWATALARTREPREFRVKTAQVAGLKVRPDGYLVDELVDATMPSCIRNMMDSVIGSGVRNRCELQIACWAKAAKLPFDKALTLLSSWTSRNRPELSTENVQQKAASIVMAVYGGASYGFSCAAARTAVRAAGITGGTGRCDDCRVVRPRSTRQIHSLRVRHDERWSPSPRIPLEKSRDIIARNINNRIATANTSHSGDSRLGVRHTRTDRPHAARAGANRTDHRATVDANCTGVRRDRHHASGTNCVGHRAAGDWKNSCRDGRTGRVRDAGIVCHADA